jgi:ribonucleotide monophosphatase NagD (HAD superfamily)
MLSRVRALLVDLSGTLHIEDTAVPGAVEALCRFATLPEVLLFSQHGMLDPQSAIFRAQGAIRDQHEQRVLQSPPRTSAGFGL